MVRDHGGQAFPYRGDGMSLRDAFAAVALASMPPSRFANVVSLSVVARDAYAIADAMLKERAK